MKSRPLSLLFFALGVILPGSAAAEDAHRPNIVFILADDMGYGDLKAYNPDSKIPTPNLDQLASEGMIFTDAHSGGSTCIPSRYALLSGNFAVRAEHVRDRQGPVLPEGQATVASFLKDQGYHTAMVGKWHLGFEQNGEADEELLGAYSFDPLNMQGGPVDRGFESWFGMHASLDIPPYFYVQDRTATAAPTEVIAARDSMGTDDDWNRIQGAFWREGGVGADFEHLTVTPRFTEEASEVIETHEGEKPLFLYLALPSPHTPWLPTDEFEGKTEVGMYGDFVLQVDDVVGDIMASLEKAGMTDDTLLVFTSDNGPVWYDKDTERFNHNSSGQLRGVKASVWEGGHRMPFIVRWPATVEAGTATDQTIAFADVFATFAELAGQPALPQGAAVDSVSFAPLLLDADVEMEIRPPILHEEHTIRDGDWKLIDSPGKRGFAAEKGVKYGTELYDLEKDLAEENNLADSMPEKVDSMRNTLEEALQQTPAP